MTQSLNFLLQGYRLVSKNLHLFAILIGLSLLSSHSNYIKYPGNELVSFLVMFLYTGYHFSIPYFLSLSKKNTEIDYREILRITLVNTRRTIIPVLLLMFVFVVIVLGYIIFSYSIQNETMDFLNYVNNVFNFKTRGVYTAIIYGCTSIFVFMSVFFSIERIGFIRSLFKSIGYSIKNIPFVLHIAILYSLSYLLSSFVYNSIPKSYNFLLQQIVIESFSMIATSAAYLYYVRFQKKV